MPIRTCVVTASNSATFFAQVLRTKYGVYEVAPESSSITSLMSSVIHYAAVNQREQHRLLADADKIAKVCHHTGFRIFPFHPEVGVLVAKPKPRVRVAVANLFLSSFGKEIPGA